MFRACPLHHSPPSQASPVVLLSLASTEPQLGCRSPQACHGLIILSHYSVEFSSRNWSLPEFTLVLQMKQLRHRRIEDLPHIHLPSKCRAGAGTQAGGPAGLCPHWVADILLPSVSKRVNPGSAGSLSETWVASIK